MKPYVDDIEKITQANETFRTVLFTTPLSQLVVMSLKPKEDIGQEMHRIDQFLRVESGEGQAILDGQEYELKDGSALVVPAGVEHNLVNTSAEKPLKLYTIYTPPEHKDGTVHVTKADAEADEHDHFKE